MGRSGTHGMLPASGRSGGRRQGLHLVVGRPRPFGVRCSEPAPVDPGLKAATATALEH